MTRQLGSILDVFGTPSFLPILTFLVTRLD